MSGSSSDTGFLQSSASQRMVASTARMDVANQALCHALRNPPPGHPKVSFKDAQQPF